MTLINSANVDICASVTIKKYGEVQCLTKENLIVDSDLQLKVGSSIYPCQGQNGECNFKTSDSLITVNSLAKLTSDTVTITGTGFSGLSGFSPKFRFVSIFADSVTVTSDTEAVATFNKGVPLTLSTPLQRGFLLFQQDSDPAIQQWAVSTATLLNPISTTALDSDVSCSFAGGCKVSISQEGLFNSLSTESSKNAIRVCG